MHYRLLLSILIVASHMQAATRSSAAAEPKESKEMAAVEQETKRAVESKTEAARSAVKPLRILTAEKLAHDAITPIADALAKELAAIWTNPGTEDDFKTLLAHAHGAIDAALKKHVPALAGKAMPADVQAVLFKPFVQALLKQPGITKQIAAMQTKLFVNMPPQKIGTFSKDKKSNVAVHPKGTHSAVDYSDHIEVFDLARKTVTWIPHEPIPGGTIGSHLAFAEDVPALAQMIKFPELTGLQRLQAGGTVKEGIARVWNIENKSKLYEHNFCLDSHFYVDKNAFLFITVPDDGPFELVEFNAETGRQYVRKLPHGSMHWRGYLSGAGRKKFEVYREGTTLFGGLGAVNLILEDTDKKITYNTGRDAQFLGFDEHAQRMAIRLETGQVALYDLTQLSAKSSRLKPMAITKPKFVNPQFPIDYPHVVFSPNSRFFVIADRDRWFPVQQKYIALFDTYTKKEKRLEEIAYRPIIVFNPQSSLLVTGAGLGAPLHLYTIDQDKEYKLPHSLSVDARSKDVHFNRQGNLLAYPIMDFKTGFAKMVVFDTTDHTEYVLPFVVDGDFIYYDFFFDNTDSLVFTRPDGTIERLENPRIESDTATLDQLFFLLGLGVADQQVARTYDIYEQLLQSPILDTFNASIHQALDNYINKRLPKHELLEQAWEELTEREYKEEKEGKERESKEESKEAIVDRAIRDVMQGPKPSSSCPK